MNICISIDTDHWGELILECPFKEGTPPTVGGPPDCWDPGDPGEVDLQKAEVTFVNLKKTFALKKLSPRMFDFIDEWLYNHPNELQECIDAHYCDDYYDDDY